MSVKYRRSLAGMIFDNVVSMERGGERKVAYEQQQNSQKTCQTV